MTPFNGLQVQEPVGLYPSSPYNSGRGLCFLKIFEDKSAPYYKKRLSLLLPLVLNPLYLTLMLRVFCPPDLTEIGMYSYNDFF
jgi:hypothetical protein